MIKTGGPAFPQGGLQGARNGHGMSMRDYFAGQVLIGLFSNQDISDHIASFNNNDNHLNDFFAALAYRMADAMIEVRDKQNGA